MAQIEALADARVADDSVLRPAAPESHAEADPIAAPILELAAETQAAWLRRPLLEQLVALQDAVVTPADAENAGALLTRYARHARDGRTVTVPEASSLSFEQLRPIYESLYASCRIRPERAGEVAWHRKKLLQYRQRYAAVAAKTGVPWWFIGVVHALEASFNFNGHLHNGEPLTARTVQVPKNRPPVWSPPNDWESSALDALTYERLIGLDDWSVAAALYRWESYNGFGYYRRKINSPYLWSFSEHYTKGKFVSDGKFNPDAVSKQCGAAVMLRALQEAQLVDFD